MSMVLSRREGAVAILTLNNPGQYNALAAGVLAGLAAALDQAAADSEVRAILLTGAGKGFCSGAQFGGDTFGRGETIGEMMRASVNPIIEKLHFSPKPVVTAVNGPAAGAGVGVSSCVASGVGVAGARGVGRCVHGVGGSWVCWWCR